MAFPWAGGVEEPVSGNGDPEPEDFGSADPSTCLQAGSGEVSLLTFGSRLLVGSRASWEVLLFGLSCTSGMIFRRIGESRTP